MSATSPGPGGALRIEQHFGRTMRCFSERPANLNAMFAEMVTNRPDAQALVEGRSFTYRELDVYADRVAAGLTEKGFRSGDRVALFLGNCHEFVAAVLACFRLGIITVPIGIRQQRAELEFLLNDCGASAIMFEADLAHLVPDHSECPGVRLRVSVHGEVAAARITFEQLLAPDGARAQRHGCLEEDVAVILYTSGTTGKPKGAQLTHLGVIHTVLTYARNNHLTDQDRAVVAVPASHVTGLVAVLLTMFAVGGCAVLMRAEFKTLDFLGLLERERISYTVVVPAIYTLCVLHPDFDNYDLSAMRIGAFGGSPMPVPTIERLAQKLPRLELINAYGATETTSPATVMPIADWRDHADSVGKPVVCGDIKVVDDQGREVGPDEAGELLIAGPMVVPGYWNRPDANASEFVDGYWRSGDIGSRDADGFIKVFDRKKDMINRGGFKVFCAEVESTLSGMVGVSECAIIGKPDPVLGERVHAIIVAGDGSNLSLEQVREFCGARMADYKVPELLTLRTAPLPRNANGKVQKAVLRKEFV